MKILVSNDDGYQAPGIVALYDALKDLADVEMVAGAQQQRQIECPDVERAAVCDTSRQRFSVCVNGTPADCVHIALTGLLGYRPDLVVVTECGIFTGAFAPVN